MLPETIEEYVKGLRYSIDKTGRSEDEVYIFEDKYILKISQDNQRLYREMERVDFLNSNNIPGSKSICYLEENGKCYYLRTYINGDSLISDRFLNNPKLLIKVLVKVINVIRSLDESDCPFDSEYSVGDDFVHGDLCLPNIFVDKNDEFIGFIDLDNLGIGDKWYDYAWLTWSLEYNLKTNKYNKLLFKKLKIPFDKEKYEMYIPENYR